MYLKRIEIAGFKSFADYTELEIYPGVTAIVGPNGSGKSNIADAIRWVLGEQSVKSLRGSKMEDVIFAGSDTRKAVNYCEVSLTLDNTDQTLGLDFQEVTVTRRVYRSGEGEYLINKQPCRLKDITELFMDTGLGKEAFSLIGQGRIEEILSTKAEDRRGMFEEAAGIIKYKARKREAEKKLEETEANLLRIGDVIGELESQLEPLREQAQRAEAYRALKEERDRLEIALCVHEISLLHQRWMEQNQTEEELRQQHLAQAALVTQQEARLAEWRWQAEQAEKEVEQANARLFSIVGDGEKAEGRREVLRERQRNLLQGREEVASALAKLSRDGRQAQTELQQQEERLRHLREKERMVRQELKNKQELVREFVDRAQLEDQLEQHKADLIECLNEAAGKRNESRHVAQQIETLSRREQRLNEEGSAWQQRQEFLISRRQKAEEELRSAQDLERKLKQQLQDRQQKWARLVEEKKRWEESLRQWQNDIVSHRSRLELLQDMHQTYGGYNTGVRHVLQAARAGKINGVHGAVAECIQVPAEVETAIETALGGALQYVIVDDERSGREAIHFLKQSNGGRATFLPLDVVRGRSLGHAEKSALQGEEGWLGVAADMVRSSEQYRPIVQYLLGQVVVAKTLADANRLARLLHYRYRIVTLQGDVVHPGGSMSGGSVQKKGTGLLGRQREMEELARRLKEWEGEQSKAIEQLNRVEQQKEQFARQEEEIRQRLSEVEEQARRHETERREIITEQRGLEERLQALHLEREQCREERERWQLRAQQLEQELNELEQQIAQRSRQIEQWQEQLRKQRSAKENLSESLTEVKVQLASLEQETAAAESQRQRLQQYIQELEQEREIKTKEADLIEQRLQQTKKELAEAEASLQLLVEQRQNAEKELAKRKSQRADLQQSIAEAEHRLRETRLQLRKLEQQVHQGEIVLNRIDVELNAALQRLADEYHLSYEWAKEHYPLPQEVERVKAHVQFLREQMSALGEVNLGAVEEYARVQERHAFLTAQREDLIAAKTKLYDVIRDMEKEMARRFSETFAAIRVQFQEVFAQLFGGGRADLQLLDEDHLLTTGIEIVAQPPGKKLQSLSLLSGGERALTAISLLFAILRVRPVPFCVLDEVEAALDEANVVRFAEYLRAFSSETQFIVITHRKGTMEGADILYGVTMEESGVSKLVSVKLLETEEQSA